MSLIKRVADLTQEGNIAVLTLNAPPVNALSASDRDAIFKGITSAVRSRAVQAIVLIGDGSTFIAGADITEFGKPPSGASLDDVQSAIENASKPVIAAMHGTALGGALEVALV
jgi:3-hydroxyacyl-CoA dehydrogenase